MSNVDRRGERRRKHNECRRPRPASCQGPVQGRWGASEIGSSLAPFWSAENLAGSFSATAISFLLFSAKEETEKVQNSRRAFPNRRRSSRKQERGLDSRSQTARHEAQWRL